MDDMNLPPEDQTEPVSRYTVFRDIYRYQRYRDGRWISNIDLPHRWNFLRYAPGETVDTIFEFCSQYFELCHPLENPRSSVVCLPPRGEPIYLTFIREVVERDPPLDISSEIDDSSEWEEPDDYDY